MSADFTANEDITVKVQYTTDRRAMSASVDGK